MEDDKNKNEYSQDLLSIIKYITEKFNNKENNNNENNIINDLDEEILKFCDKKKYFNEKGTKLLNETDFPKLISFLEKYLYIDDYIIPLFNKLDINLIKVIINGYISYDIKIEEKEKILSLIDKLVPLLTHTDYIYYIYNKLSKIFRLNLVEDESNIDETFSKFNKIFDIWKNVFSYNKDLKLKEKYISFYGNNNIVVNINNINQNYSSTVISIDFIQSSLSMMNCDKDNFTLMKIFCSNYDEPFEIKANDIELKDNKTLSEIDSIRFTINDNNIIYIINNEKSSKKEIKNENFKNKNKIINKIELLDNFYGKIASIKVARNYKKKIAALSSIIPNKFGVNIKLEYCKEAFGIYTPLSNINDPYIKGILDNKEKIEINLNNNSNIFCKYYPIEEEGLTNIKYLGGFDAFIPIFKILKYFIVHKKNNELVITFMKDIFKIILDKICSDEKNLKNLYEIMVPLTGAISEIVSLLTEEENKNLFQNDIFYNLYIFIIISPLPKTSKDIFKKISGLNDINAIDIDYKEVINENKLTRINSIEWYCCILFVYFEFNLLVYNDVNKLPKELFEQLFNIFESLNQNKNFDQEKKSKILVIIQFFARIINQINPKEVEILKDFKGITDLSEVINGASNIKEDLAKLCFLMVKIFLELNNMKLIKSTEKDSSYDKFYNLFLTLKNIFKIQNIDTQEQKKEKENLKNLFKDYFMNYQENKKLLNSILDIKDDPKNYLSEEEKLINEFVDYERQYLHLMKEQFIFNGFWSNKKLFFNEDIRAKELKYKSINYYTENFQRPIVYPVLDYKYQYPSFSYYVCDNNLYMSEEFKDNYDFILESQELEELIEEYNENNINLIKDKYKDTILMYDVCLIKRTHHVKGKLFLIKGNIGDKIKKIYFISYPKSKVDIIPSCNYLENNSQQQEFRQTIKNKHVCYGSFFICPDKDCNIKIEIKIEDIRMILRRIYFYRKSAFEIFTSNKSYYFNFFENPLLENNQDKMAETNSHNLISLLANSFNDDLVPVDIKNQVIGYSREFNYEVQDIILQNNQNNINIKNKEKDKDKEKDKNNKDEILNDGNKFIDNLLKRWINENNHYGYINNDISTFDLIILLNLISNRSYNDLYQYPVFPVLYLYDKIDQNEKVTTNNLICKPRTLSSHIGFQTDTKGGEARKKMFINSYEMAKEEINDGISDITEAYYFNTNYSNNVYTCDFLLRIFPYSFIAIEIQGDGFDDPNRLFHAIENTFYSISTLNTDLRELIPEFYFFPEMFININKLNFKKKSNGDKIDNVNMPEDKNIVGENNLTNNTNYNCFKFIEYMRNNLENKNTEIYSWLNLIFGNKQKYNSNKKDQYFRSETYFSFDKEVSERLNNYLKNDIIMSSVEFGLIPIQTLFNDKEINKNENNSYANVSKNTIERKLESNIYKSKKYTFNIKNNLENKNDYKINNINKNYTFKNSKNKNINISYNDLGKIEIYINDKLIKEFYHCKNIITYIDYNKRLNMFIITSIDGYSYLYSFPNKLLSVIKHPNKGYFDYIVLSSNPFPSIIAFDKANNDLYSYSLNGFFINKINLSQIIEELDKINSNINIYPIFNTDGGTQKDVLVIQVDNESNFLVNVPFFEKEINFIKLFG